MLRQDSAKLSSAAVVTARMLYLLMWHFFLWSEVCKRCHLSCFFFFGVWGGGGGVDWCETATAMMPQQSIYIHICTIL